MMQLENDLKNIENDLSVFIKSKKANLVKDRLELQKKSPVLDIAVNSQEFDKRSAIVNMRADRNEVKKLQSKSDGLSLNLGGYENKQEKLRAERQKEYRDFLAEQNLRTRARNETQVDDNRNQVAERYDRRKEYRSDIDKEYDDFLKRKQKEEKAYRVQFSDLEATNQSSNKKVIEFDSDEEELFKFVTRAKQKRQQSADAGPRKRETSILKDLSQKERSNSVPPELPAVFGGSSRSSLVKERNKKYQKELEEQIKERELLKAKEKLKRLGRVTSDIDITEIEITKDKKYSLPVKKMINERSDKADQPPQPTNYPPTQNVPPLNPYTMFMNPNPYPANPMLTPMMTNMPQFGWNNYGAMGGAGMNGNGMMGFFPQPGQVDAYKQDQEKVSAPTHITGGKPTDAVNIPKRPNVQPPGGVSVGMFGQLTGPSDLSLKKAKQQEYQEELKRQMEEKRRKADQEKAALERYERKMEEEIATYNPWGKGGGGAPMRTQDGKIMADLRKLRNPNDATQTHDHAGVNSGVVASNLENDGFEISPLMKALEASQSNYQPGISGLNNSGNMSGNLNNSGTMSGNLNNSGNMRGNLNNSGNLNNKFSPSYARGAALKELQGVNKSPRDKLEINEYKSFLQQQIDEKKRKEDELKEQARLEEEKENRRIAEQQRKIQEEYEIEKEKQRKKEEEIRDQNDQLRVLAERKKYEKEKEKKEIAEEYDKQVQKEAEIKLTSKNEEYSPQVLQQERSNSPPVPAIAKGKNKRHRAKKSVTSRKKQDMNDEGMEYLQAVRTSLEHEKQGDTNRANMEQQKHLIRQLSALRNQLQKQEVKIETELKKNQAKYSELATKNQEKSYHSKPHTKDVFEKLVNKNPGREKKVDIERLKLEDISPDYSSDSDHKTFDAQQQEYMRQQETRLKALRKNVEEKCPQIRPELQTAESKRSLLDSDSKFISMHGNAVVVPHDNNRHIDARARRRMKDENYSDVTQDYFGKLPNDDTSSIRTFQVEDLARKNEKRLQKLRAKKDDDEDEDADHIIRDFMRNERKQHGRDPSEVSLTADTYFTGFK